MAAGVRILGGHITIVDEAAALNYGYKQVGIYSCSWGPRDNGKTMGAPRYLIRKAFAEGINNGRDGKGSIFVFASGNGGRHDDQCNFDGYTNTIYSVTVGSVDYKGLHPTYSEGCAANMIVAYSSGSGKHIVCITHHRFVFFSSTLTTFDRRLQIEGKDAHTRTEEPQLLHPMPWVFLRLHWKRG